MRILLARGGRLYPAMYPLALKETLIEAVRACFWRHESVRYVVVRCGVKAETFDSLSRGRSKGTYFRDLVNKLADRGADGRKVLDRIAREVAAMEGPLDPEKLDHEVAAKALKRLKAEMAKSDVAAKEAHEAQEKARAEKRQADREEAKTVNERAAKLDAVKYRFYELHGSWKGSAQSRGYALEILIGELFAAYEIPFQPPYRTGSQQIDGCFTFQGRHFLLEARWRRDEADFAALSHFHSKTKNKLTGTLGLFLSMEGFSPEAEQDLLGMGDRSVLLMDGTEFVKLIEQQITLHDALGQILADAHMRGTIRVRLRV